MEKLRDEIIMVIDKNWPVSVTEVAEHLGIFKKGMNERKRKAAIGKIIYHVKKLKEMKKIRTKKIGQTVIIWPNDIEKLRVVHEMLREENV
jgi:predicted transcriptional regulator